MTSIPPALTALHWRCCVGCVRAASIIAEQIPPTQPRNCCVWLHCNSAILIDYHPDQRVRIEGRTPLGETHRHWQSAAYSTVLHVVCLLNDISRTALQTQSVACCQVGACAVTSVTINHSLVPQHLLPESRDESVCEGLRSQLWSTASSTTTHPATPTPTSGPARARRGILGCGASASASSSSASPTRSTSTSSRAQASA